MQEEEVRLEHPQLPNLARSHFIEAEPCLKNAHTATHMAILNNKLVFIAIESALHVYCLSKMTESQAPLVSVIPLNTIFEAYAKERYQDLITSVFRKAEKQDFSSQIFNEDQDPKSNILLNIAHLKARLNFFNNSSGRVKSLEVCHDNSKVLLLLHDGRAAVLSHPASTWTNDTIESVNLNDLASQKIDQACFVARDQVCLSLQGRVLVLDLTDKSKTMSHRHSFSNISRIKGHLLERQRYRVFLVYDKGMGVLDLTKKKISSSEDLKIGHYINQSFFFKERLFLATHESIIRVDCQSLEKEVVHEFGEPCEVSHMDEMGNFCRKTLKNNRETLWLAASTTNGVFIGLTIRRNGNYKEGRLLVFECPLSYYILRLLSNIHQQSYIDTSDSLFIPKSKENKQILQDFATLYKREGMSYNNMPITMEQYNVARINLGHAFQGKQIAKAKVIEKTLADRFERLLPFKKRLQSSQLLQRCCFTGTPLFDEEVVYCKDCDVFGIRGKGDKCVVCYRKMQNYE